MKAIAGDASEMWRERPHMHRAIPHCTSHTSHHITSHPIASGRTSQTDFFFYLFLWLLQYNKNCPTKNFTQHLKCWMVYLTFTGHLKRPQDRTQHRRTTKETRAEICTSEMPNMMPLNGRNHPFRFFLVRKTWAKISAFVDPSIFPKVSSTLTQIFGERICSGFHHLATGVKLPVLEEYYCWWLKSCTGFHVFFFFVFLRGSVALAPSPLISRLGFTWFRGAGFQPFRNSHVSCSTSS